jgi:hypothetical protein
MDVGGGVQAEAAVAVLVVIPAEEVLAVRAGGLDGSEPGREVRPVTRPGSPVTRTRSTSATVISETVSIPALGESVVTGGASSCVPAVSASRKSRKSSSLRLPPR